MIAQLKLVEPCNVNRQVAPGRVADMRAREYLTPAEIEKLIKVAKQGRWGDRDATLITVGLPAWLARCRGQQSRMEPSRVRSQRLPPRPPGQER